MILATRKVIANPFNEPNKYIIKPVNSVNFGNTPLGKPFIMPGTLAVGSISQKWPDLISTSLVEKLLSNVS